MSQLDPETRARIEVEEAYRAQLKASQRRKRSLGCLAWLGGAFVLAALALLGLAALGRSSADDPPTASERQTEFVVNCERAVRDNLKAPATAEISNAWSDGLLTTASGFAWNGHVDAENSFGANMRTNFRCQGPPETPTVTFQ